MSVHQPGWQGTISSRWHLQEEGKEKASVHCISLILPNPALRAELGPGEQTGWVWGWGGGGVYPKQCFLFHEVTDCQTRILTAPTQCPSISVLFPVPFLST